MPLLVLLVGVSVYWTVALPLADEEPFSGTVNIETVTETFRLGRSKRSVHEEMPEDLHFRFPIKGQEVNLRLKRSNFVDMVTDAETVDTSDHIDHAAVYHDHDSGASLIVKRAADGQYRVAEGSFHHEGEKYSLRHKREAGDEEEDNDGKGQWSYTSHVKHNNFKDDAEVQLAMQGLPPNFVEKGVELLKEDYIAFQDGKYDREIIFSLNSGIMDDNAERKKRSASLSDSDSTVVKMGNKTFMRMKTVVHTIEMSFVCDYTDYTWFVQWYGRDQAFDEMRMWYTYVANEIDIRFRKGIREPGFHINTAVLKLFVVTNPNDTLNVASTLVNDQGSLNGTKGLLGLEKAVVDATLNGVLPVSDHYIYFTQLDLVNTAAITFLSSLCKFKSISILEDTMQGNLGEIGAHALGHSLSALHDGDTNGECANEEQYIMADKIRTPVARGYMGNPWLFSKCSIKKFQQYLESVSCTEPKYSEHHNVLPAPKFGQVINKDEQCRLNYGDTGSFFCQDLQKQTGFENLCGGMYCDLPDDHEGYCASIMPQERTHCGERTHTKWCLKGECVDIFKDLPTKVVTEKNVTVIEPAEVVADENTVKEYTYYTESPEGNVEVEVKEPEAVEEVVAPVEEEEEEEDREEAEEVVDDGFDEEVEEEAEEMEDESAEEVADVEEAPVAAPVEVEEQVKAPVEAVEEPEVEEPKEVVTEAPEPEPVPATPSPTTTPEPTTTTTTTPEPTTTTTTTPEPTTTTTTPEPTTTTTTTTTTTPEPTTTTTTPEPTTTTTTAAPTTTTTTTTTTPKPTTTTTTTKAPAPSAVASASFSCPAKPTSVEQCYPCVGKRTEFIPCLIAYRGTLPAPKAPKRGRGRAGSRRTSSRRTSYRGRSSRRG